MDDHRLDKIEDKLDKIVDRMGSIDVTLAKQSVILEEHVKRSNMLEDRLKPIEKHVSLVGTIIKIIGAIGALGGTSHGIFHYLMKLY